MFSTRVVGCRDAAVYAAHPMTPSKITLSPYGETASGVSELKKMNFLMYGIYRKYTNKVSKQVHPEVTSKYVFAHPKIRRRNNLHKSTVNEIMASTT